MKANINNFREPVSTILMRRNRHILQNVTKMRRRESPRNNHRLLNCILCKTNAIVGIYCIKYACFSILFCTLKFICLEYIGSRTAISGKLYVHIRCDTKNPIHNIMWIECINKQFPIKFCTVFCYLKHIIFNLNPLNIN